jgi:outer membrane protein assembly factor BamB
MRTTPFIPAAVALLLLAGCADPGDPGSETDDPHAEIELDAPQPRVAVLHEGGILVLDAATLESVADVPADGITRLAEAGDGRHVMLTTEDGFAVLDGGAWTDSHGDHGHSYATTPQLSHLEFPMDHPGHVVPHHGTTALFSDGAGTVTFVDSDDLDEEAPATRVLELETAHHGVALQLSDGVVLVTAGDDESRRSVLALAPDGTELARTDDCPDVHGETAAANEAVLFGCTGAVVVHEAGAFRTIALPDAEGGVGGPAGSEDSPVVLADYTAPGETYSSSVALVDLATDGVRLVELPAEYYYWSLARDEDGDGVVLATDGALHIVDVISGALTASVPVIDAWTPPEDWRDPAPSVTVLDGVAYVTDPAGHAVHAVALATGELIGSAELGDTVPHGLALIRG